MELIPGDRLCRTIVYRKKEKERNGTDIIGGKHLEDSPKMKDGIIPHQKCNMKQQRTDVQTSIAFIYALT